MLGNVPKLWKMETVENAEWGNPNDFDKSQLLYNARKQWKRIKGTEISQYILLLQFLYHS